jgi:hypothetical protein
MKSRVISLGASVIALTMAAAVPATAQDLDGLKGDLKAQTEVKVGGPAGSIGVNGDAKLPVALPKKDIAKGEHIAKGGDRPRATVEAGRRSGDDRSQAVVDWNGGTGVTAYADHRRKGVLEAETLVRTDGHRASGTASGFASGVGSAKAHGRGKFTSGKHSARAERSIHSIRRHTRPVSVNDRMPSSGGHHKLPKPLRAIGREVGNPIQLSLAGWLLALAGAGFGGTFRLVRRLQRVS